MSGQDWIDSFDSLFTNNQIQKLKILLPCLNRPLQRNLAVCIKYLELRYTMTLFKRQPEDTVSALPHSSAGPGELCDTLLPFCTVSERNSLSSLRNMLQTFEQYKEMMEMMAMMQELFPQGTGGTETSASAQMKIQALVPAMEPAWQVQEWMEAFPISCKC